MKTVMKKIFSLMLVAVLLVSAVPFAASAAEETKAFDLSLAAGTYSVDAILAQNCTTTSTNYWVHCHGPQEDYVAGASFEAFADRAYTLYVVETVADPTTEPTTEPTTAPTTAPTQPLATHYTIRFQVDDNTIWSATIPVNYTIVKANAIQAADKEQLKVADTATRVFMGWTSDEGDYAGMTLNLDHIINHQHVTHTTGDITYKAVFKTITVAPPTSSNQNGITNKDNTNKVYLHVYLNGNASVIALTKDITDSYLLDDDKTSNAEIWTYLKNNYYTAQDANVGLLIDGLYVSTGSQGTFPQNYYTDTKQDTLSGIEALRDSGYVHINVMLKNAAVKGSSTQQPADTTNPKTGDNIFAPIVVLGLSTSALAVLFFLNKKRAY